MARGSWGQTGDANVFRVAIQMARGTNRFQTGFHLRDRLVATPTPQGIATDVADWVNTHFKLILTTDVTVVGVDVVNPVTKDGGSVSPANEAGTVGVTLPTTEPLFIMAPVQFKSDLRARYGQGRGFWPVLFKDWCSGDQLNAGGIAGLQGCIDSLVAKYVNVGLTGEVQMINLHGLIPARAATPTRPERPAIPPTWYDVQSVRLNTNLSFLRSRKSGVGS